MEGITQRRSKSFQRVKPAGKSSSSNSNNNTLKSEKTDCPRQNSNLQREENGTGKNSHPPADNGSSSNGGGHQDEEEMRKLFSDSKVFENWCSIKYFEYNVQVGRTFHLKNNTMVINVNNYNCSSNNTRFCLGTLTNEHQNDLSRQAKRGIGSGIHLYLQTNGDVWLRQNCTENERVFVESNFLIKENRRTNNRPVQQICTHAYNKIFSLDLSYKQMKQHFMDNPQSRKNGNNFKQFYSVRVGFVEEWGPDCPLKTAEETPCWIKIFLHPAIKLLNNLMNSTASAKKTGNKQ